jgi:hypothetical protein
MAEKALDAQQRELCGLEKEEFEITDSLLRLQIPIELNEKLVEEKKQSREEISSQSLAVTKQGADSKLKDLQHIVDVSGAAKIDKIEEEFEKTMSQLQEEYNRKKAKLEERIEAERDKMSSDVTR